ncbi:SMI1/KNR4 family protein [Kribbella sp. VKM Ac-2571]|uniref:SMI1/KNR4 family protein n=1 Tax=Kribbella sp. VKM Ac-2571 TaxID=2512222 RepID=UPI0010611F55|nr:SMI1/KNR4 family protein [Kribbella sp. VKM Ac-2571]
MVASVQESWTDIVEWLREYVPSAVDVMQPPVSFSCISALRSGMGRRLPGDLVAWLNMNNGLAHRGNFGNLLPTLHTPLPCEKMLARREMLRGVWSTMSRPGEDEQAGSRSPAWLDAFLPIADSGTDVHLFVDLRDGELFGCIGEYSAESGGFGTPIWPSTAHMLADVADALRSYDGTDEVQSSSQGYAIPFVEDAELMWTRRR